MKSRDFCYWLQGYFELESARPDRHPDGVANEMTAERIRVIRNHLNMVFEHEIDPSFGDKNQLANLSKIHSSGTTVMNC